MLNLGAVRNALNYAPIVVVDDWLNKGGAEPQERSSE